MSTRVRTTYLLLFATWILLTGRLSAASLALGLLGIVLATLLFGQMFLPGVSGHSVPDLMRRVVAVLGLVPMFLVQAARAAVKLAYMALQPKLGFQPGVVRVPTTLKSSAAITLLANLVTLSPGTLTLEVDYDERCYYIHCIDVRRLAGRTGRRDLIARYEAPLRRIFE